MTIDAKFKAMGQTKEVFNPEKAQVKEIAVTATDETETAQLLRRPEKEAQDSLVDYK